MHLTKEEFNEKFQEAMDWLLQEMAEDPEVDLEKFYTMTCLLENMSFFSPVIYGLLKESKKQP